VTAVTRRPKRSTRPSPSTGPTGAAGKAERSATSKSGAPRQAAKRTTCSGGGPEITQVAAGVLHDVPEDLRAVLTSDSGLLAKWNDLTPIQRNEWICWVTIVKKPETRVEHIERLCEGLGEGERQPCCWPGCPHLRPKAKKWFRNL
jgi:hypothetical protein